MIITKNNGASVKGKERYYYKEMFKRFRIFDRSERFGTDYICIADCMHEHRAKKIVTKMNEGLKYDPTW